MNYKISDLITALEKIKTEHGDIPVRYQTISHRFEPEPVVKESGTIKYVLLNP